MSSLLVSFSVLCSVCWILPCAVTSGRLLPLQVASSASRAKYMYKESFENVTEFSSKQKHCTVFWRHSSLKYNSWYAHLCGAVWSVADCCRIAASNENESFIWSRMCCIRQGAGAPVHTVQHVRYLRKYESDCSSNMEMGVVSTNDVMTWPDNRYSPLRSSSSAF